MGPNSFTLRSRQRTHFLVNNNNDSKVTKKDAKKEKRSNLGRIITRGEAEEFVNRFQFPSTASISIFGGRNITASYDNRKTNPNVFLFGGDEHYLQLNGFTIANGRNISREEVHAGQNVCLLGYDVAKRLFKNRMETALNAIIRINNIPYRVLAVMKSRGSSFGFSRDNLVVTSYVNISRNFPSNRSYVIGVMTQDILQVPAAMSEAAGVFRPVRKLNAAEENNFVIDRSDSIAEKAMNSLRFLTISATVIGFITLIGAAIGLMNIMLVSVSERTREVGLAKAIGGKSQLITRQFLLEAIIISILGAIFGILLGILVGNLFAMVLGTGFVVPWNWVLYGIIICTVVGLVAGLYPALKAGRLNPIDALRYE
jgi:putative ABC transport system permease protein